MLQNKISQYFLYNYLENSFCSGITDTTRPYSIPISKKRFLLLFCDYSMNSIVQKIVSKSSYLILFLITYVRSLNITKVFNKNSLLVRF